MWPNDKVVVKMLCLEEYNIIGYHDINLVIRVVWRVFIKISWKKDWWVGGYYRYLYQSVYLVIWEIQSGEVVHPSEDQDLDHLQLVVAQVQLHHARPPVSAGGRVGKCLDFVVTERKIRKISSAVQCQGALLIYHQSL